MQKNEASLPNSGRNPALDLSGRDICDIVIPVWNAPAATAECVNSIIARTHSPYRLIIIDNGSDKETADYLIGLKDEAGLDLELIRNDSNLGFVKAVNQGIKASGAGYVCLMNNDTIAEDGWLEEMIRIAQSAKEVGIVNPSSNTFGQEPIGENAEKYASRLRQLSGQTQELYSARGFCMLIKRELIDAIGLFDETFGIGYFEETDFSLRAYKAGFRTVRAKGAYVYHKEQTSFRELKDNDAIFAENEKIFFERWPRPLRIGYFAPEIIAGSALEEIAKTAASGGHQIFIFLKKGAVWPVGIDHINIRRVDLDPLFFGSESIYHIFKRSRKKKLELLFTDNPLLGNFLKITRPLHGSEVFINADKESLIKRLKENPWQI